MGIDNAVGAGNHRLFVVFLTVLWSSTVLFYSLVGDLLAHNYAHGLIARLPETLLVTVLAVSNLLWLGFVSLLLLRTLVYMICNVTTLEVIIRPAYIVARFPKRPPAKYFETWFLDGLTLADAWKNVVNFWTQEPGDENEDIDFQRSLAPDSPRRGVRLRPLRPQLRCLSPRKSSKVCG